MIQINPDKDEYAWGEQVVLTAVPGTGSVFAGWSGDAGGSNNPLPVTMNANKNIVARFIVPKGPFSDNFNACSLGSVWGTPIDEAGNATFAFPGQSLRITVPAGDDHVINKSLNNAPRIMQDATDADLDYVVKFNSDVTQNVQTQGILIEQSDARLMRVDFYYNPNQQDNVPNDEVVVYAGIWTPGALQKKVLLPIAAADANYLRVTRVGIKWTIFYSATGQDDDWQKADDFNYDMPVNRVGVYAGNLRPAGTTAAPAFTADIDFFYNATGAPLAADKSLLTVNVVGTGTVSATPPAAQLTCGQTVSLRATPGLGMEFSGWSGDATGAQNPLSMLINRPRTVTATFTGTQMNYIALPMIIR